MRIDGQIAVVTGGGQGIGRAICRALAANGARVMVSDLDPAAAARVAAEIGGAAQVCDVTDPDQIAALVKATEDQLGPVDIWISNAGFARGEPGGAASASDAHWQASWDVHVMAHLRAARLLIPGMQARGHGALVNVASAAGLLCQIGDAAYSATKHAAVSLAQSLAITHGDKGIHVAVVCPLFVATPLLGYDDDAPENTPNDRVILPADVAQALIDGLEQDRFLILPHPEAGAYFQRRAADTDRWIKGMSALRRTVDNAVGDADDLTAIHRHI
ncbi:SDR family oxidoreductase [Mesobacterium sp. TK19101]|uniref:SDR family oxidoreductase n=1 Tax=Mesobacterium hydrothermale TaxID=3111907 RepID=A0ABU6HDZ9_9RHOB|nr:SDR family oxidoreductase [Mesobacterium sp. TK19101]MEC3860689.1 SDR family oxidoreductase [Mesobacterium sp. TK19101]